jgi:hypothetical protein
VPRARMPTAGWSRPQFPRRGRPGHCGGPAGQLADRAKANTFARTLDHPRRHTVAAAGRCSTPHHMRSPAPAAITSKTRRTLRRWSRVARRRSSLEVHRPCTPRQRRSHRKGVARRADAARRPIRKGSRPTDPNYYYGYPAYGYPAYGYPGYGYAGYGPSIGVFFGGWGGGGHSH